jgi:uncharacterized protein
MTTRESIDTFLSNKKVAVAGVSRSKNKFGYQVFEMLLEKGYDAVPVNPHAETLFEKQCYADVKSLPDHIESLLVLTPKAQSGQVIKEAVDKNIRHIWIQQGSDTPEAINAVNGHDINLVTKKCIFMFAEPVTGVHKFHRGLMKLFGLYPKK